jgi:uncharacterized protein (TIGR01244 family)
MSRFRDVTPNFAVSPQITVADVHAAAADGFAAVIINRPDGEELDQPRAADIAAAARAEGLRVTEIPINGALGPQPDDITRMAEALAAAPGPVLAYCRSGTRSVILWALAQAHAGVPAQELIRAAAGAGYDISGLAGRLGR